MLSILIPTYNYNVFPLCEVLLKQALQLKIPFEIRVYDDGSPNRSKVNSKLQNLSHVQYKELPQNIGRTAIRNKLAKEAAYNKLLFLDADVLPEKENFLKDYVEYANEKTDVIFGGVTYTKNPPDFNHMLRWKYGKEREKVSLEKRNKNPYQYIISASFLIKKNIFLEANSYLKNAYGADILFAKNLERASASLKHIDNPVIHLGLESNHVYLKKSTKGVETIVGFTKSGIIPPNTKPLQKAYLTLKKWKLIDLFSFAFGKSEKWIQKNLLSANPSLFLFDLYRLYHYVKYMN